MKSKRIFSGRIWSAEFAGKVYRIRFRCRCFRLRRKTNVKQGDGERRLGGAWYWEGLNIFTNFLLIFFIPPYLAALVLSIVAMAQRRIG